MSRFKKVGTGTIEYIREVGCSQDCSKTIPINKGLPLPCKEFTNMESALLRKRALKDEQLFASGFTRIVDRSAVGDDLRIKNMGIDIGEIRTEASGARSVRECRYNYEGVTIDEWEKRFYVVNTNKHLKMCPRDFVGSKLQDLIGDRMTDFDEFQDTDLADILVGAIIEKYTKEFVAKFILLSVFDNEGENMHGDDGILAKAYYAHKGQYFHTVQYDFSTLASGKTIEAIVGGKRYSRSVDFFLGDADLLLLDFVDWLNNLKQGREYLYSASISTTTNQVTLVSRFAVSKIRLRVAILDDGTTPNWGSQTCTAEETVPTEVLQNAMPINDVPLLFQFEEINETNFVALFKKYTKEFMRYLHRNGFEDLSMNDVKIGIDPELMLERDDATVGAFLAGGIPINFMEQIGLSANRFVPLNALNGTGLFFMTIDQNILVLGDASNEGNGLPGTGVVKIKEVCEGEFSVIFDNPIGSAVEHFGAFASNLCESWFVTDNNLDNRSPYENTRETLACYTSDCVDSSMGIKCNLTADVEAVAVYDDGGDQTNITVTVKVNNPDELVTVNANLGYSLSDGTSGNTTSLSFVITLPGDQTETGLVLNVYGTLTGTDVGVAATPNVVCIEPVNYSVQFGTDDGYTELTTCDHTGDLVNTGTSTGLNLDVTIGGTTTNYPLVDTGLDAADPLDFPAIELEIEAIIPGSEVTLTEGTGVTTIDITMAPSVVTVVDVISASANIVLTNSCA